MTEVTLHEGRDQLLVASHREGVTVAVLVDGEKIVDLADVDAAWFDARSELGHSAFVGSHLLAGRRGRRERREEREDTLVTDGGHPEPLDEAHQRAIEAFHGSFGYLPDVVREHLEELGWDADDLEPLLGGIRGGLWREDVPHVVQTILENIEGPVEIDVHPEDDGHHWRVEWHRVDDAPEFVTDGGVDRPLPAGLATPRHVDVATWATELAIGDRVRFQSPHGVLEADILGFSTWDRYRGQHVVKPPDEIVADDSPDLLVLREEDLVDVQDAPPTGDHSQGGP